MPTTGDRWTAGLSPSRIVTVDMSWIFQGSCLLACQVRWRYGGSTGAGAAGGGRIGLVVVEIHYKLETGHGLQQL